MEAMRSLTHSKVNDILQNDYETRNAERAIFNYTIQTCRKYGELIHWNNNFFRQVYRMKAIGLISNLDPNGHAKNMTLLKRFKEDPDFQSHKLVFNSPQDLHPERWQPYFEHKRRVAEALNRVKEKSYTTEFICPKCRARKCTYIEVMTRSADEPMTLFVTCAECNHKFRR